MHSRVVRMQPLHTTERRRHVRGTHRSEPPRTHLVRMILGMYREMPGLTLHLSQAARLFGLKARTCRVVLEDLVNAAHLRRTEDGQYAADNLV